MTNTLYIPFIFFSIKGKKKTERFNKEKQTRDQTVFTQHLTVKFLTSTIYKCLLVLCYSWILSFESMTLHLQAQSFNQ